jgi:hypothetical protein
MHKFSILVGLMVAVTLAACSPGPHVSERIATEAAKAGTIDLATLTPFPWDRALVFGPYASTDRICAALPKSFADCAKSYPQGLGEGSYLLTFIRDSHVIHHELHSRRNGEFCSNSCVLDLRPQTARFTVGPSPSAADRKHFTPAVR